MTQFPSVEESYIFVLTALRKSKLSRPGGAVASSREGNQRDSLAHQIFVLVLMVAIPLAVGFGGSQLIDDETDG